LEKLRELRAQRLLDQILQVWPSPELPHLMLKVRVWNWVPVAEVVELAHRALVFPQIPQPVQALLVSP
jgi:hypothetical protein